MKNFSEIYTENQIEEFHEKRMSFHIRNVKKYLLLFAETDLAKELNFTKEDAIKIANKHDKDKIEGDLYDQYKYISWQYHCKIEGLPCDIEYTREMDEATQKHILTSKHHPEAWDENYVPVVVTDFNKRDNTKLNTASGEKMDIIHLIELCADWSSTSRERGNTPQSWMNKCKNDNRYIFSKRQWYLIENILNLMIPLN